VILGLIGVLLIGYGLFLDRPLNWIGTFPYGLRVRLLLPADRAARVPDGLPDVDRHDVARAARQDPHVPVGLGQSTAASRCWVPRRCPLIATAFGLSTVLMIAGGAYLLAISGAVRAAPPARRQMGRRDEGDASLDHSSSFWFGRQ